MRHPEWIRTKLTRTARGGAVRGAVAAGRLHTICEEARCPNRGECWDAGTATFLVLGGVCTRNCKYCSVNHGIPGPAEPDEPRRVAVAVRELGCRYAVITSVTRDDMPDGGAAHFAAVVRALRDTVPGIKIELLVPDFKCDASAITAAVDSQPDVFGHNIEVVRRLFSALRPQGNYDRSLALFDIARRRRPGLPLKSGLMVGLGETREEITVAMNDLRAAGVSIVTVGQYLQPSRERAPVSRYVPPDEFEGIRAEALALGFSHAMCGPLVRSSYHAGEVFNEDKPPVSGTD
jgi:lipoyl synthase